MCVLLENKGPCPWDEEASFVYIYAVVKKKISLKSPNDFFIIFNPFLLTEFVENSQRQMHDEFLYNRMI